MKMESWLPKKDKKEEPINLEKSKMTALVDKIREKYPTFEKTLKTPGKLARLMTVLITLEGGQLFAQEVPANNLETKNPFSLEEIMNLNTMTFTEIASRLEPLKKSLPNKKATFSSTFRDDDNLEGTDYNGIFLEGIIPSDTGMIGNAAIVYNYRLIEKYNYEENDKKEGAFHFNIHHREFYTETKVFKLEPGEMKETKDTVVVIGGGSTKEEAIMEAIKWLSLRSKQQVCAGSVTFDKYKSDVNDTKEVKQDHANYLSSNGISYFKDIHVDKITKENAIKIDELGNKIGESNEIIYHAYISAQK